MNASGKEDVAFQVHEAKTASRTDVETLWSSRAPACEKRVPNSMVTDRSQWASVRE
jgi:hypothetical protein